MFIKEILYLLLFSTWISFSTFTTSPPTSIHLLEYTDWCWLCLVIRIKIQLQVWVISGPHRQPKFVGFHLKFLHQSSFHSFPEVMLARSATISGNCHISLTLVYNDVWVRAALEGSIITACRPSIQTSTKSSPCKIVNNLALGRSIPNTMNG